MLRERQTSQDTNALANRIAANNQFGSADLTAWLLDELLIQEGETLLDLGCGTGKHLLAFARAGAKCTGLDVSASSLQAAEAGAAELGVELLHQSMDDLEGVEGSFDTVTSVYALYYSADATATLAAAKARLRPEGRIAVFGPYSDNNAEWFDFIGQFMELPETVRRSTTSFMFDEVLRFANESFGTIRCQRFVNRITIPSPEALREYWRSNIYYREELDPAFEAAAAKHFAANETFQYSKVGQLIEMRSAI